METSAFIVMITTETSIPAGCFNFEVRPGEVMGCMHTFLQPDDIISVKITYGEEDSTITFNGEFLEKKLLEIGGANEAAFLIRSDGVQIISRDEIRRWLRKRDR